MTEQKNLFSCTVTFIDINELPETCSPPDYDGHSAIVTNITNRSEDFKVADMTANLILRNLIPGLSGLLKNTKIICRTRSGTASANLTLTGL